MTEDQHQILRRLKANRDGISVVETAKDLIWDKKRVRNAIDGLRKEGYEIKNYPRFSGRFKLSG